MIRTLDQGLVAYGNMATIHPPPPKELVESLHHPAGATGLAVVAVAGVGAAWGLRVVMG